MGKAHPSTTNTQTSLECQIQETRHLNLIFPYLKSIEMANWHGDKIWLGIRDLVRLCQDARQLKGDAKEVRVRHSLFLILFFSFYN